MKVLVLIVSAILMACSSSSTSQNEGGENYPPPKIMKESKPAATPAKRFAPAKPMKCTYDTDCVVQDSCSNSQCKLTGNTCRFRSDCPSPRGTCVNKKCEFL